MELKNVAYSLGKKGTTCQIFPIEITVAFNVF